MVEDALRRFSQDRTGLADYALESGGQRSPSACLSFLPAIFRLQGSMFACCIV